MTKHQLSEHSTVYHYTLLSRFTWKHPLAIIFSLALTGWLLTDLILFHAGAAILMFTVSSLEVLLLHAFLAFLYLRFSKGVVPVPWEWRLSYPFFGFLPAGYITAASWARTNLHRFFIGSFIITLPYIWLPRDWFFNLLAAHVILLFPQLSYIRKCTSVSPIGLVKINKRDVSLYKN